MNFGDKDRINRITDLLTLPPFLASRPLIFLSTIVIIVSLLTTSKPEFDTDISVGRSDGHDLPANYITLIYSQERN
jgi:hypothetical protein